MINQVNRAILTLKVVSDAFGQMKAECVANRDHALAGTFGYFKSQIDEVLSCDHDEAGLVAFARKLQTKKGQL